MNALTISPRKAEALAPGVGPSPSRGSAAFLDVAGDSSGLSVVPLADEVPLERSGEGSDTAGPSLRFAGDQTYFELLAQWEGRVVEVRDATVFAVMRELSNLTLSDEESEFPIDEVEESDRPNIQPGAVFYLNVGYSISRAGVKRRAVFLKLRKLVPPIVATTTTSSLGEAFFSINEQ